MNSVKTFHINKILGSETIICVSFKLSKGSYKLYSLHMNHIKNLIVRLENLICIDVLEQGIMSEKKGLV